MSAQDLDTPGKVLEATDEVMRALRQQSPTGSPRDAVLYVAQEAIRALRSRLPSPAAQGEDELRQWLDDTSARPDYAAAFKHETALGEALVRANLSPTFSMRRAADAGFKLASTPPAEQPAACICMDGNQPDPIRDCPVHGEQPATEHKWPCPLFYTIGLEHLPANRCICIAQPAADAERGLVERVLASVRETLQQWSHRPDPDLADALADGIRTALSHPAAASPADAGLRSEIVEYLRSVSKDEESLSPAADLLRRVLAAHRAASTKEKP